MTCNEVQHKIQILTRRWNIFFYKSLRSLIPTNRKLYWCWCCIATKLHNYINAWLTFPCFWSMLPLYRNNTRTKQRKQLSLYERTGTSSVSSGESRHFKICIYTASKKRNVEENLLSKWILECLKRSETFESFEYIWAMNGTKKNLSESFLWKVYGGVWRTP